uniref:Tr-type G domain-containing protein n=1 Tax=Syphacia muris TaxID=451379 RepID=A0A0N5AUX1_9BILA
MNIGLLGHVDSGKTSLARALSTLGSTAAFDKHAVTGSLRANTIDLGFSTLTIDDVPIALIDCPGHASLIKAVLAIAPVFDMAIVVVSADKGIEPQTAEHLLLVSLLCPEHVIVVLNKVDLVNEEELCKVRKNVIKGLKQLNIASNTPVLSLSLTQSQSGGVNLVTDTIRKNMYEPKRILDGKFVMSVDHCFPIKGKGEVLTGTVVSGRCRVGMEFEIPMLKENRKIKEMQRWKKGINESKSGDRVALLVTSIPDKRLNRFVICEKGALAKVLHCLATVNVIKFFKGSINAHSKLHFSFGFDTVMATCQFLKKVKIGGDIADAANDEYEVADELSDCVQYVLLSLDQAVYGHENTFYITSKLDSQAKGCRFIFYGKIVSILESNESIKCFHRKHKVGKVERLENSNSIICSSLFNKGSDVRIFEGMQVRLSTGEDGVIEGSFGKSGKVRVTLLNGLKPSTLNIFEQCQQISVNLYMKKFLHSGKLISYLPEESQA